MNTLKQQLKLFLMAGVSALMITANAYDEVLIPAKEIPAGLSANDWAGIQSQITAASYRAQEHDEGGYISVNPTHGWQIRYSPTGTTTLTPRDCAANAYHLGLKLNALGYERFEAMNLPQKISAENMTVTYQWTSTVREFWINQESGLEQWFVLERRPEGMSTVLPLTLQMTLDSNLTARQIDNTLHFENQPGTPVTNKFSYNKLRVWDSTGAEIPASMHLKANSLSLMVDDSLAQYPLTIDPIFEQQAYLKASNTDSGDEFGFSVAISGETLVVGAYLEDSSSTGINGDEVNNLIMDSGAVYVFTREEGFWSQQAYLKASNTDLSDYFGWSVAISGDTLVVGAYREDSNATGINGDDSDNSVSKSGAVYVFFRRNGVWSQQAYLKASDTDISDYFGWSVAISEDTLVIGAPNESSNATGVNGDDSDNSVSDAGAAYVFLRTNGVWNQQAYLKASNTDANDYFGWSVAVAGNTLVVGARGEGSNAMGVNGDETDNSAADAGAAYVFTREDGIWSQRAYLKASNTEAEDRFGESLAISGNTLLIGAYWEDSSATGVNGDGVDNSAEGSGAAYVFTREEGLWSQQAYLKASNTREGDEFGRTVAISGNILVIGARGEDSNATGVDGDVTDYFSSRSGAVYVISPTTGFWSQKAYLKASNAESLDEFGRFVAISELTVVVGAVHEDSIATGVNGDETDNSAAYSGAAYVFNFIDVIFADSFEGE